MSQLTFEQKKEIINAVYELKQTQPQAYEVVKDLIIRLSNQNQREEKSMSKNDLNGETVRKQKLLISDKMNVTIDEAVELMSIGKVTLNKLAEAGYIPSFFVGAKRCFPRWALEEFTRNFVFKRIDLQTLEVSHIDNDYEELVQRLKQENQTLNNKLDMAKKALA